MTRPTNDSRLDAMAMSWEGQADLLKNRNVLGPGDYEDMHRLVDQARAIRAALRELADLRAQVASFKEGKVDDAGN